MRRRFPCLPLVIVTGLFTHSMQTTAADAPDYGRDVRPILSQFCFKCHGPDETKREAGLRLDVRDEAVKPASSGERPIVPTEPAASELIRRIHSAEPDERMPPASTKMQMTDAQKSVLHRWIAAGAEYKAHWSFVPPQRPTVPLIDGSRWSRGAIDSLVLSRLAAEQMRPSPDADRLTLIRRAAFDLTGLPPGVEEADEFANDQRPDAYERVLDRLLASPSYGERWARRWLDLARYADTNGYEKDRTRSVWPYRDWVINSLNANLPFDQFTIEQLAGDMLPDRTQAQRIATGFHRNTMLNEEGGIDPLEFRFYAMTDRVATTATVWLGLTLGCAQCHTHKYDPITHQDYYSFFALLNNADEPELEVVQPDAALRRAELQQRIAAMQADLPNRFPLPDEFDWTVIQAATVSATSGARFENLNDGAVIVSGPTPETDRYEVKFDAKIADVTAIRLEALIDSQLPGKGPGRTSHGNFVLSEITATVADDANAEPQPLKFVRAAADFSQEGFSVEKAIDGDARGGGWAIHGPGDWNVNRTATFILEKPVGISKSSRHWTVVLYQSHGTKHVIGKFRISLGRRNVMIGKSEAERRTAHFQQKYADWLRREVDRAVEWTLLRPVRATSNLPLLTIQDDQSIFVSGDMSKRDLYDITFAEIESSAVKVSRPKTSEETAERPRWTALRIEVLPDDRLPKGGPGRVYYEGPFGDFFLSEVSLKVNGVPVKLTNATQSLANGGNTAAAALDGNQQTGWSINGGQGKAHVAVFRFAEPVDRGSRFDLSLLFERYYAAGLGRFRVSVTDDSRGVEASRLPPELEPLLLSRKGAASNDSLAATADDVRLLASFCELAPELAAERKAIAELRSQLPANPTSLAFEERPANNPRLTYRYHRGEFLQPKEQVEPAMLRALPPLPPGQPANRLTFARWLVSSRNPLGARVTVNREWAAFFGRGLVRTVDDFGSQGASPTHPLLLDWLAVELEGRGSHSGTGWDLKRLHRMITTSATYRQSSHVTPDRLTADPSNELLSRGPRFRLEAELVRDFALSVSGLLSQKLCGPSVFPPQPASVTTEGTYGGLAWNVSPGEDRFRRTLYTFSKRTAPFAMGLTFDAPSGEACIARREVTNTPLQALTLLNDMVFVEAAQALGREFAARTASDDIRLQALFRRCLTRFPTAAEVDLLREFLQQQRRRIATHQLDATALAGPGTGTEDAAERAVWTVVARALLNLDEAVTRN